LILLDGKALAYKIRQELKQEVKNYSLMKSPPKLCVVMVGDHGPSHIYVRNKILACEDVGIQSHKILLPEETTQEELRQVILSVNQDPSIHGVLVQFPLPKGLDQKMVLETLSPGKDADGLTYGNLGRLLGGGTTVVTPCTPQGILALLKEYQISLSGKKVTIVGRSLIVGKPLAVLLTQHHATVTLAHSRTQNLKELTLNSDICIFAAHQKEFFGRDYIKQGAIVIDVGIHSNPGGKPLGDTRFQELQNWASYLTPVPGGVGPLTIAMLLVNTLALYKASQT
jgi:methylenetetrahydrofolate dehydrogenase (NADP+) / methenyltetrahydrofolate cyclohydrolase